MQIWATILLILKNWKYVVQFLAILERAIINGANTIELNRGLKKLDKGFEKDENKKDVADSARSINDSFRQ